MRLLTALILVLSLAMSAAASHGTPARDEVALAVQSSVMIAYPSMTDAPFCAGVFMASDLVLTANHCIGEPSDPQGKPDPKYFNFVAVTAFGDAIPIVEVVFRVPSLDLIVVRLERKYDRARIPEIEIDVARGDPVIQVGAPETESFMVTYGKIGKVLWLTEQVFCNSATQRGRQQLVYVDTSGWFGSSGGGVFTSDGKLIGIVSGGVTIPDECGKEPMSMLWTIVIGPETVQAFLKEVLR